MTVAERERLARILGMLGSEHAGERASAALHAEPFRKKHRPAPSPARRSAINTPAGASDWPAYAPD